MTKAETLPPTEPDPRVRLHKLRKRIREQADFDIEPELGEVVYSGGRWQFLRRPRYTHVDFHTTESTFIDDGEEEVVGRDLKRRMELAGKANAALEEAVKQRSEYIMAQIERLNALWLAGLQEIRELNPQQACLQYTVGANELLGHRGEGPKVVVDKLLCRGWIALLAGASKSNKSWLALQLAVAVSNGWSWLGFHSKAGRVLYVDHELSQHSLQNRLSKLYKAHGVEKPDETPIHGPEFLIMRAVSKVKNETQIELILRILNETHGEFYGRYDLIILDPLYMFLEGQDENNATEMVDVFNTVRSLQQATGAAILINAHFRKGVRDFRSSSTTDHIAGSGVFTRYPDVVLTLSRLADGKSKADQKEMKNVYSLDFTVRHLRAPEEKRLLFNADTCIFKWLPQKAAIEKVEHTVTAAKQPRGRSRKNDPKIVSYLKRKKKELDGKPLAFIVKQITADTGISQSTVYRFFKNKSTFTYVSDNQSVVNMSRFAKMRKIKL